MGNTVLDALVRREEMAELIEHLALDGRDLLLVTLILGGMDAPEIAQVLRISTGHVYALRSRLASELAAGVGWLAEEKRLRDGTWPAEEKRRRGGTWPARRKRPVPEEKTCQVAPAEDGPRMASGLQAGTPTPSPVRGGSGQEEELLPSRK